LAINPKRGLHQRHEEVKPKSHATDTTYI